MRCAVKNRCEVAFDFLDKVLVLCKGQFHGFVVDPWFSFFILALLTSVLCFNVPISFSLSQA